MKNYYDELEVSKTASKDVIEKVYKVLAKKYHPDTTTEIDKQEAEEKFKRISEAYKILSDDDKRKKYDLELAKASPTISYEEYISVVAQRDYLKDALNDLKNEFNRLKNSNTINQQHYHNNHIPYNQINPNLNNSIYNNSHTQNSNYANKNTTTTSKNKTNYYTTDQRPPLSAFYYFIHKIKEFFSNIRIITIIYNCSYVSYKCFLIFQFI